MEGTEEKIEEQEQLPEAPDKEQEASPADKTGQEANEQPAQQEGSAQEGAEDSAVAGEDEAGQSEEAMGDQEILEEDVGKAAKKGGKKSSKKLLLLIIAVVVIVIAGAAVGAFLFIGKGKGKEQEQKEETVKPPAYYFTKGDGITSVTELLGERKFELLLEDDTKDREDGDTDTQEAMQEEETQTAEEEQEPVLLEVYQYYPETEAQSDVDAYVEYLTGEKNFIDITDVEIGRAPEEDLAEGEDGKEGPSQEEEPILYVLAGPGAEEGNSLVLSITLYPDRYQIRTRTEEQSWTQYMAALWEERELQQQQQKPDDEQGVSRDYLDEKIAGMSSEELQLPEAMENYEFLSNPGVISVDGEEYARVTAYFKNEAGTLDYVCCYLLDAGGEVRYKYNEVTGEKTPLGSRGQ